MAHLSNAFKSIGKNDAKSRWKKAGATVMAANHFTKQLERNTAPQLPPVSQGEVEDSLRKNSILSPRTKSKVCGVMCYINSSDFHLGHSQAWMMGPDGDAPRLTSKAEYPCRQKPDAFITQAQLEEVGIIYMKLPVNNFRLLDMLAKQRGYVSSDTATLMEKPQLICPNSVLIDCPQWYQERFNTDEEIYLLIHGDCYYDFRDRHDNWVRISMSRGSLVLVPAGCCYRFCRQIGKEVAIKRLFKDADPGATPMLRSCPSAENEDSRKEYKAMVRTQNVFQKLKFTHEPDPNTGEQAPLPGAVESSDTTA